MGGGARSGGLRALVRLERRHVRASARFLLFAAGADIDEERDLLDRAYQLYLLIFVAVSLVLSFAQILDLAGQLREGLGVAVSARLAHLLLVLAPAAGLVAWGVSDLRETPLRLTAPDITWLARVVRPEELFVVRLLRDLPVIVLSPRSVGPCSARLPPPTWVSGPPCVPPSCWPRGSLRSTPRCPARLPSRTVAVRPPSWLT